MTGRVKAKGKGVGFGGAAGKRRSARLTAVQLLYEMDLAGTPGATVIGDFTARVWRSETKDENEIADAMAEPDAGMLSTLVLGVEERRGELDGLIDGVLSGNWTTGRLELVLRAIMRAGTYELLAMGDVPPRVVINEYMDVAHAFFALNEPGLVNGVLDRLARTLRPGELEPAAGEAGAENG